MPRLLLLLGALPLLAAALSAQSSGPAFTTQPSSQSAILGATVTLTSSAAGSPTYQWLRNGADLSGQTTTTLSLADLQPATTGLYSLRATSGSGSSTSDSAIVGLTSAQKVEGSGTELSPNVPHPNGNIFDQVLVTGAAVSITSDWALNQITRASYIDLDNDIVQIEFSGPGTLSLVLDTPTGPAQPLNYTQAVNYMKGHAGIVITGATENTHVSVFTVGRATAFDPSNAYNIQQPIGPNNNPAKNGSAIFSGQAATAYNGIADIAFIAIASSDGKFGGIRTANANYFASKGLTGVYAPGVAFQGPVNIGDVTAFDDAKPVIVLGSVAQVLITGGSLDQANDEPVEVSGVSTIRFVAGSDSQGNLISAKTNLAVLEEAGANITSQIVVDPASSVPAAPASLAATAGDTQIALSWEASSGATTYYVYRGTSSNGQYGGPIAAALTSTNFTDTGLTNGATYYYKVVAANSTGTSSFSTEVNALPAAPLPTVGSGSITEPAIGPAPSFGIGGDGFTLVKNWDFGSSGTIKNMSDMDTHFQYHDQFGTIANGANYGAITVASSASTAINDSTHGAQPYVGQMRNGVAVPEVRTFSAESLSTSLVPLGGASTVSVASHNAGNGSFVAKWALPRGGSLLNQDVLWEVRVRYVTPPYFWFAIWTAGTQWNNGAEMDIVESFGWDNGGGNTNYDGRFWHSDSVGGNDTLVHDFLWDWPAGMASRGITNWNPTQYHIWQWVYRKDETYDVYMDGIRAQSGTIRWRLGGTTTGTPINMYFLCDAGWGHVNVSSVNKTMAASEFDGKYYEWDYSRVYLRP